MLKDKAKKDYQREYMKRKRSNKEGLEKVGLTSNIDSQGVKRWHGICRSASASYPDIIDKLTDPVWRGKLEKICSAFSRRGDMEVCWLGDTNLSTVCDYLRCTG